VHLSEAFRAQPFFLHSPWQCCSCALCWWRAPWGSGSPSAPTLVRLRRRRGMRRRGRCRRRRLRPSRGCRLLRRRRSSRRRVLRRRRSSRCRQPWPSVRAALATSCGPWWRPARFRLARRSPPLRCSLPPLRPAWPTAPASMACVARGGSVCVCVWGGGALLKPVAALPCPQRPVASPPLAAAPPFSLPLPTPHPTLSPPAHPLRAGQLHGPPQRLRCGRDPREAHAGQ
jgi:hypothetical protein